MSHPIPRRFYLPSSIIVVSISWQCALTTFHAQAVILRSQAHYKCPGAAWKCNLRSSDAEALYHSLHDAPCINRCAFNKIRKHHFSCQKENLIFENIIHFDPDCRWKIGLGRREFNLLASESRKGSSRGRNQFNFIFHCKQSLHCAFNLISSSWEPRELSIASIYSRV